MTFVRPRRDAVEQNEMYRKSISGYIMRLKVRPGIMGCAQIYGLQDETAMAEKLRQCLNRDPGYVRRWSLSSDT
jgi:lipopolysaccharide/colanic/teichoic acid biosynthesis glycosyltransferase